MLVHSISIISGRESCMELDITPKQYEEWISSDRLVQDIFPNLNENEREFLLSGITPEEWESVMEEFMEE